MFRTYFLDPFLYRRCFFDRGVTDGMSFEPPTLTSDARSHPLYLESARGASKIIRTIGMSSDGRLVSCFARSHSMRDKGQSPEGLSAIVWSRLLGRERVYRTMFSIRKNYVKQTKSRL